MNLDTNLKNSFFVIGTDTDIGKTYVCSLLFKGALSIGCSYYKPIQSGGIKGEAPDVKSLCDFNNIPYNADMEEFVFEAPLSPHLACEVEKSTLNMDIIEKKIYENDKIYPINIIEGAGGIYVPLIRGELNYYEFIQKLGIPVILVASTRVGTINHTMLTLEFLKSHNIPLHGVVFNKFQNEFYEKDNINMITHMGKVENYLIVGYSADESLNNNQVSQDDILKFLKK